MPHYDSRITATVAPLGTRLDGEWKKRSGPEKWTGLHFRARAGAAPRFASLGGAAGKLDGRFATKFEQGDLAVAILRPGESAGVEGTFLRRPATSAGSLVPSKAVDCGSPASTEAHAFLFDATADAQGALHGDFWSGDNWHEKWEAKPDPNASLPDGFDQAHWRDGFGLAQLLYPDLDGVEHSLGEVAFSGKAIVIQVSARGARTATTRWPTSEGVRPLQGSRAIGRRPGIRGDRDWTRDAQQVRRMRERHGAKYPVLLAGSSDKQKASEAFPAIDRVLAFPTTIFLHRDGRVRAVHSGFAGPATKEEHEKLRRVSSGSSRSFSRSRMATTERCGPR